MEPRHHDITRTADNTSEWNFFQPPASSAPDDSNQPATQSSWDAILGPPAQKLRSSSPVALRLDDFRDAASPSFKPDYHQKSSKGNPAQAAKRNLMGDFHDKQKDIDKSTADKIRRLGDPFTLNPPDTATEFAGQEKSAKPLKFLTPSVAAPFFAAVMIERGIPIAFPEESTQETDELGVAGNRMNREQTEPRPFIPLLSHFKKYCDDLTTRNQPGPKRINWVNRTFKAPKDHESKYFTPPPVPAEAWSHMQLDTGTWTNPEKPAPAGVEGGSGTSTAAKRRKVPPWNQQRDAELSGLETLARDGMRLANASLLTFSHLMNGLLDEKKTMDMANQLRTFYTLKDLQYCTGEHFCRLASQLAHLRKVNAISALNLADARPFRESTMGPDLFGGQFKTLYEGDTAKRKARAEQEKQRKAQSKKQAPRGDKQSTYRRDSSSQAPRAYFNKPAASYPKQESRRENTAKSTERKSSYHGRDGSGASSQRGRFRGGKRGGGGGSKSQPSRRK